MMLDLHSQSNVDTSLLLALDAIPVDTPHFNLSLNPAVVVEVISRPKTITYIVIWF